MFNWNFNSYKNNKIISCFLVLSLVFGMISTNIIEVKAENSIIGAQLTSEATAKVKNNSEVTVTYKITPQQSITIEDDTSSNYGKIEEAVFIFDLSGEMSQKNRIEYINKAISEKIFTNELKDIKFGVVGYNNNSHEDNLYVGNVTNQNNNRTEMSKINSNIDINNMKEPLISIKNSNGTLQIDAINTLFKNGKISDLIKWNGDRNISKALSAADYILTNKGDSSKQKAIILLNSGNVKYDLASIENLKSKGYTIISLDISGDNKKNDTISKLHTELGGTTDNYIIGQQRFNYWSDFNRTSDDMQKVANILKSSISNTAKRVNPILNLNLGSKLEFKGIVNNDQITYELNGNNLEIKLPEIIYTKNSSNVYTTTQNEFEVTLKFKISGNNGDSISFNSDNNISYNDFNGTGVVKSISTPTYTIDNSIVSNEIRILEVQPSNLFILKGDNNLSTTGTDIKNISLNNINYEVIVEHISMPEFIGKVDKINGKYDVVIIGAKNSGTSTNYTFNDYKLLENDITDRKAKEIGEFINSGQLVYIDSKLSSGYSGTKLNKHLTQSDGEFTSANANLIKNINTNNITIEEIASKYLENNKKRAQINIINSPTGDTGNSEVGVVGNRNLNFIFNISDTETQSEVVSVNLYLDINGDGLFKEEEIVSKIEQITIPRNDVQMSYTVAKNFIGYLDWKIEVVRNNNIKSYTTGNFTLKKLQGVNNVVKVLQIDTNSDKATSGAGYDGKLDLLNNTNFKKLVEEVKKLGYEIQITRESISDFNKRPFSNSDNISILNGQYNMIIVGFRDSFPAGDFTNTALKEIEKFGKTGQGIMFTHDNIWYTGGDINTSNNSEYRIIKRFADYIGQSRFVNNHNTNVDLQGNTILHDEDKNKANNVRQQQGATIWSRNDVNNSESVKVYQTNKALITSFPYNLSESELNNIGENFISVRRTHAQYLQLNLENENVVPWFNLTNNNGSKGTSSNVNQYDVRNNYYTYSIGNVTFSGTGENRRDDTEYPLTEMKLFVNTIIKAERGANHAPVISSNIIKSIGEYDSEISTGQEKIDFKPLVEDIDNDNINITVSIKNDDGTWTKLYDYENLIQGQSINCSINNPYYNSNIDEIGNKIIEIKVDASDIKGADAETIIYKIKPTAQATIGVEVIGGKGLVGEPINLEVKLSKLNTSQNTNISDVRIQTEEYSENMLDGLNKNEENIDNLFIDSLSAIKTYNVTTNIEGTHSIKIKIKYKVNNEEKELQAFIAQVESKKGEIKLIVKDENGNSLGIDTTATIGKEQEEDSNVSVLSNKGSIYSWPDGTKSVTSSNYKLKLTTPAGYVVNSYSIQGDREENKKVSGEGNQTPSFIMNYENPKAEVVFVVEKIGDLDETINILEVEPADSFKLSNSKSTHIKSGIEKTTVELEDGTIKQVQVEHISMPEFVGKVDKINGKYDIVVIGRFNDTVNITNSKNKDQLNYRDYNNNGSWNNDITVRKVNEIKDFINSGQLVYIDKEINNIQTKNLKQFQELFTKTDDNCNTELKVSEMTLSMIVNDYMNLDNEYKNINFTLTKPTGDSDESEIGDPSKRKIEFNIMMDSIASNNEVIETVDINLYLDINGDGIYEEPSEDEKGEIVKTLNGVKISSDKITLEYQIASDFVGYLDWKIEIVKSNNIKSYITDKLLFRSLTGKKIPIKVLQVSPYNSNDLSDKIMGNLNLGPVNEGGNLRFNNLLQQVKDYDIQIEVISMNDFNKRIISNENKLVLNGNYDMIIFGFGDTYGGSGNDITVSAAKIVKEFINTGQSVMFTHDTFWDGSSTNRINEFLKMVGQKEDIYTVLDWKTSQSKTVYQTNDALITNYPFDLGTSLNIRRTHKQWYQLDLENENLVPWYTITPYTVTKDSSNSDYQDIIPQDILDELARNKLHPDDMKLDDLNREINQASSLGYETWLWKENTSPGENGVDSVNQYDVKNSYYTYSVGNIVFSGTAENTKEKFTPYPTEELKLFVNTIAKAIRGANHSPVINESNIYNDMEIDKEQEEFKFSATFTDIDNDDIRSEIYINDVLVNDVISEINGTVVQDDLDLNQYFKSGTSISYSIPKKYYATKDSIDIKIRAIDNAGKDNTDGAISEKSFNIKVTILPIKVEGIGDNGLIGDDLNSLIKITKLNVDKKTIKTVNIKLTAPDNNLIEYYNTSTPLDYTLNLNEFNNDEKVIEYKFKAKEAIQGYKISGVITYSYTDNDSDIVHNKTIPIDIPINIKSGEIDINIVNETGRNLPSLTVGIANGIANKPAINNNVVFKPIASFDRYNVSIEGLGTEFRSEATVVDSKGDAILGEFIGINYNNPTAIYTYKVYNATTITHGIYEGIGENDIEIYEYSDDGSNEREYARNTTVPFAASFDIHKGSTTEVILTPGGSFTSIKGNPTMYMLDTSGSKPKLIKLGTMSKESTDGDKYIYKVSNSEEDMKLVVLYNYKILGSETWYTNKIRVYSNIEKEAKVKVKKQGDIDSELPDLF